ncbi:hypothetical protein [Luteolibacter marinus]|uniref:hypothetical protein n=1 Tax=Luteolibacter marinus TaxID=2776705 RepID=UPI001868D5BB|nr:hypothetical protein [Luteolibacter marinus]
MSKLIFAALAISAVAENAEAEAVKAIEKLKSDNQTVTARAAELERVNGELKKQVDAAAAEAKKTRKERAETLVKAAVADGRIAPKDEERQTKFRDKIEAGDSFAEEILAGLPKLHEGLDQPVILAGQGDRGTQGGHGIETKARELVTAKQAESFDQALELIAASDPALYSDYLKSLGTAG